MFKLIYIGLSVVVAMSGLCPKWECSNDQTVDTDYHCAEFRDDKFWLADQGTVCKGVDKQCLLSQAVQEINSFGSVTATSFCTTQVNSVYYYDFEVLSTIQANLNNDYTWTYSIPQESGCSEYAEYYAYCVENIDEEEAEDIEEEIDESQADAEVYSWKTCSSDDDCQDNSCLCVPSSDSDGRCGTSLLDKRILEVSQIAAACEQDEVSVCTLNLFYNSLDAVLWTSILEEDLSCANLQTWELNKQNSYHLQDAMDWYNKAKGNAQIIVLMTGALLSLL